MWITTIIHDGCIKHEAASHSEQAAADVAVLWCQDHRIIPPAPEHCDTELDRHREAADDEGIDIYVREIAPPLPVAPQTTQALSEYEEWSQERQDLSGRDDGLGEPVDSDEWFNSDDSGIEILHALTSAVTTELSITASAG